VGDFIILSLGEVMFKFLFLIILITACGQSNSPSFLKEPINQRNDPRVIPGAVLTLEYTLNNLPDRGNVDRLWYNYWFPMSEGGTATTRFGTPSPMTKYDAVTNNNYAATNWEQADSRVYAGVSWAGHCNGSSAASIMNEEPTHSVTYKNMLFTTDDIKALLTEAWQGSGAIIGDRCDKKTIVYDEYGRMTDEACRDVNPGTFHLAITNYLGLFGKAIIVNTTLNAVWNYPVQSYEVISKEWITKNDAIWRIQKKNSAYSYNEAAVEFVYIKMSVTYLGFDPHYYDYILELDQGGKILGGEWLEGSKKDHPDFIWRPDDQRAVNPNLDLKIIKEIYLKSL
jgi:hypothetical protein